MENFIKKKVKWQKSYDSRVCKYFAKIGLFDVCVVPDTPNRRYSEIVVRAGTEYLMTYVNEDKPFSWEWANKSIKKFFNSDRLEKWMNL